MNQTIKSINELKDFISNNLNAFKSAQIICLCGDLGSGKTTFSQELGKQLGTIEEISSPTFIIQNEYNSKTGKIYHIDLYRLESEGELNELKLDKLINPKNHLIIEWADKYADQIKILAQDKKAKIIWIYFEHIDENTRLLKFDSLL